MKIYLATPYSHDSEKTREERFKNVNKKASELMNLGHIVYSPISHSHPIAVQCGLPLGWEYWEKYDTTFIEWCDELMVYCQSGWEKSNGVKAEIKIAKRLNKSVKYLYINLYERYDTESQYHGRAGLKLIAETNGYKYISEMMHSEYIKLKSFRKVGKLFGITWYAVRYHIKKMGCNINGRGGANRCKKSLDKQSEVV